HIPGIIHIPLGLLEFRVQDLNKDEPYIIVCRSGACSSRAAEILEGKGFNVSNMVGGMLSWEGEVQ
ncbi:rhodanese-like domain-containing protein, partial [Lysinibacillus sp. D4B1_S16]|uniref:rhodanese-like domain-containing protein n=1 Tax=Lysinibacillus sp. D4B1_S16 TaxID=2941231 RepID=UPI0020C05410